VKEHTVPVQDPVKIIDRIPGICVGADKFLARPTSRCRRTESIASLECGVC
jgi:hypothetical protein